MDLAVSPPLPRPRYRQHDRLDTPACLALPSGMIAPPSSQGSNGELVSLELYTRSPKGRAIARCDYFKLQACARAVLRFLITRGRGTRCRMWWSVKRIARALPRSGIIPTYSASHVRRAIGQLEDAGLVRCTTVKPGECFPSGDAPDVDGGGRVALEGGRVREVNMAALLGDGPVWPSPRRRQRSQPASAFVDVQGTDPEATAAGAALRALVALNAAAQEQAPGPAGPPTEIRATAPVAPAADVDQGDDDDEVVETPTPVALLTSSDHPCSRASDHPCDTDLGSPTENHHDPDRHALARPEGRVAVDAASRPRDSHARPTGRPRPGGPLTRELRADQACTTPPSPPSSTPRASPTKTHQGEEEQTVGPPSEPLGSNDGIPPRGLTAANAASEPLGSAASFQVPRGADAQRNALRDHELAPRQREADSCDVRSNGQRPVQPSRHDLSITDPDGVQHSITDVLREMPAWFRALGNPHRRSRAVPPAARGPAPPTQPGNGEVVVGPAKPRGPGPWGRS